MLEGTYRLGAQTPVGKKTGRAVFARGENGNMRIRLEISGLNVRPTSARIAGDTFEFAGSVSMPLVGSAPFTCSGSVNGNALSAEARSGDVSIKIAGERA